MPSSTSSSDPPPRGPRRWPAAALLALAAFLAAEHLAWASPAWLRFCARYAPPGPGDPLIVTARAGLLPEGGAEPPVLLVGSSQIREGLDCAAFEAASPGRPCANLATGGGSPLDALFVARRAASRWPRRLVVTGVFAKVLHMEPKPAFTDAATARCVLGAGGWRRVGSATWLGLAYGLFGRVSETLRDRDALRAVRDTVGGEWRRAWRGELPAQPDRLLAGEAPQADRYFDNRLGRVDFDTRPNAFTAAQERALDALVTREKAAGNVVVLVDFPTRPGYETTLPPEAVAHYEAFRARLHRRTDAIVVRPEQLPPLFLADFLDFTHLSASGREKVSRRVAEIAASAGR
jgi:hypothetical protein